MPSKARAQTDAHALWEQERNEITLLGKMEYEQIIVKSVSAC